MADPDVFEMYRTLRETIKHAAGDEPLRSILIVDVDRNEPSAVALNLARAFDAAHDRCVVVDTNFRTSTEESKGLAELMRDENFKLRSARDADEPVVIEPGTGGSPDDLSTPAFRMALERLQETYEYAILTCDEYPKYGDALAIAPAVDAVVLVISAGVTRRVPAVQARDALERVGARILGMVMIERPRRWF